MILLITYFSLFEFNQSNGRDLFEKLKGTIFIQKKWTGINQDIKVQLFPFQVARAIVSSAYVSECLAITRKPINLSRLDRYALRVVSLYSDMFPRSRNGTLDHTPLIINTMHED